jgi:SAM-dependent methyltransferase
MTSFQGSIPDAYDRYLRPLFFEEFARDVAARLPLAPGMRVLEVACGTGIVTRALLARLPGDATLVATDLSDAMLAVAQQSVSPDLRLAWQPADAMALPFDPGSFDVVVCQFGIMFFPDKLEALRQMRRVLKAGGLLLISTWDSFDRNPLHRLAHATLAEASPAAPPGFYPVPCGFHDVAAIRQLVAEAGFGDLHIERLERRGTSASAFEAAMGLVLGSPAATELEDAGVAPAAAVDLMTRAIEAAFGGGAVNVPLAAIMVAARADTVA